MDKPQARHHAVRAARLLRRRRPGHPDRRAGAREVRRAGLCAARDRPQQIRGRGAEGARARCSSRSSTRSRRARRRWCFRRMACPRRCRPTRASAQHVLPRCHLPAGQQGAYRGQPAFRRRPRDRADRPCRACRGDRHDGAVAARARSRWSRRWRTPRRSRRAIRDNLAFVTQTTLSVDDTSAIVEVLRRRFPAIALPHKEDICYATTNRQEAVKKVAPNVDAMIVVGAPKSLELGAAGGSGAARRLRAGDAGRARRRASTGRSSRASRGSAITAGASAPEALVDEVIEAFAQRFEIEVRAHGAGRETIVFNLPRELRDARRRPHERSRSDRDGAAGAERLAARPARRSGAAAWRSASRRAISRASGAAVDAREMRGARSTHWIELFETQRMGKLRVTPQGRRRAGRPRRVRGLWRRPASPRSAMRSIPSIWGNGYATEAAAALRDWIFRETDVGPLHRLCRCAQRAVAARCCASIGMTRDACRPMYEGMPCQFHHAASRPRMTEPRDHPHRRRLLGQSRARAAGARCCSMDGTVKELKGGAPLTTNNQMELTAAIEALNALKRPVRGRAPHRQHLRQGRAHQVDPRLEEERLADGGQEAGQERRAVAGARRGGGAAQDRLALGQGPRWRRDERARRRAGQ